MKKTLFKKNIFVISMFLLSVVIIVFAKDNASYLIVKKPTAFTILNKYEQEITQSEKNSFIAYSPLQILSNTMTLGDELTKALKFQFQNELFFLLRDDKGTLIGLKHTGYRKILQDCKPIHDTISILKNNSLLFSEQLFSKGERFYLNKDDQLVRMFKYQNHYFLLRLSQNKRYGWSSLNPSKSWKILKKQVVKKKVQVKSALLNRISKKITEVNDSYQNFFNYFNHTTGLDKSIPHWDITDKINTIILTLKGNSSYTQLLTQSTGILIKEFENILIGEPFTVNVTKGKIVIEPEN